MDEATEVSSGADHPIDARVHQLMDQRLEAARALADASQELTAARATFEEAQRGYAAKFKEAEKAGWDRKELTGPLGLEEPAKAPRARRVSKHAAARTEQKDSGTAGDEQPSS